MNRLVWSCATLISICLLGCDGGSDPARLTLYSGRNEKLIQPLIDTFSKEHGIEVAVRYGSTAEIAAALLEEGSNSPADLFISQDAGALGALSNAEMLRPLPGDLLERVPESYRSERGDWIGLSGRARVVVYNTTRISPEQLPQRLEEVGNPIFRGRFGVAPNNASFQAHMAAYLAATDPASLDRLLTEMAANEPKTYSKNSHIVQAVITGEVDWGLVNHYYLLRALKEDPDAPAANFVMPAGTMSGFINVAGAGLLSDDENAGKLMRFLVSEQAQRYFAEQTFEYPVATDEAADRPGDDRRLRFGALAEALPTTQERIRQSGLARFR